MLIFGVVSGVVFGLIPLVSGLIKKKFKLGALGFASAIIGGAILGIYLSIPVSAVFSWLIFKKPAADESANAEGSSIAETGESDVS